MAENFVCQDDQAVQLMEALGIMTPPRRLQSSRSIRFDRLNQSSVEEPNQSFVRRDQNCSLRRLENGTKNQNSIVDLNATWNGVSLNVPDFGPNSMQDFINRMPQSQKVEYSFRRNGTKIAVEDLLFDR